MIKYSLVELTGKTITQKASLLVDEVKSDALPRIDDIIDLHRTNTYVTSDSYIVRKVIHDVYATSVKDKRKPTDIKVYVEKIK